MKRIPNSLAIYTMYLIMNRSDNSKAICAEPLTDNHLTNVGFGGVSSTCPATKVMLPHTWGNMANTGCSIVKQIISHYPFVCRLIIVMLNDSAYICMFELCWFQDL